MFSQLSCCNSAGAPWESDGLALTKFVNWVLMTGWL